MNIKPGSKTVTILDVKLRIVTNKGTDFNSLKEIIFQMDQYHYFYFQIKKVWVK